MANPILKEKLLAGDPILVAGVWDEISAIIFTKAGFEALKLGSHQTATSLGLPDLGLVSPKELREKIFGITDRTETPLAVDFESGFGGIINAVYWARQFEKAGATAIHIDDYGEIDKCPWLPPYLPSLDRAETVVEKIKAICDSRRSSNFLVIARSGAPFSAAFKDDREGGLEEGIRRSVLYKEAGADVIWGRAYSEEGLRRFRKTIPGPFCTQISARRKEERTSASHYFTLEQLHEMGYQLIFTGTALIPVAIKAMLDSGIEFRKSGDVGVLSDKTMEYNEWNELVGLSQYLELRKRYSSE